VTEIKPTLPQWVDPGEVKHTWPPPNPDGIVSRELPHSVLTRYLLARRRAENEGVIEVLEGTAEFNRGYRSHLA
jgi:hypothetical protein